MSVSDLLDVSIDFTDVTLVSDGTNPIEDFTMMAMMTMMIMMTMPR